MIAVGAVVLRGDEVLLVRRKNPPLAGRWTLPGGRPHVGETYEAALRRELREETGLSIRIVRFLEAVAIESWVVLDWLAVDDGGSPIAGDDALDAKFVPVGELDAYEVTDAVARIVGSARRG